MLNKTLLATLAAGMIAAGTLATAGAASAAPNGPYGGQYGGPYGGPNSPYGGPNGGFEVGGPGWSFQFNARPKLPPRQVCQPVFKPVKWWDRFGRPHWTQVAVGQKCFIVPPMHGGPHPWMQQNWNQQNWNGGYNGPGPW